MTLSSPLPERFLTRAAGRARFRPAPFIALNLVFSAAAFYIGALAIIDQKAQSRRDKANAQASAAHREELARFQSELLEKNNPLTETIHTLTRKVSALTEEVHAATCTRASST